MDLLGGYDSGADSDEDTGPAVASPTMTPVPAAASAAGWAELFVAALLPVSTFFACEGQDCRSQLHMKLASWPDTHCLLCLLTCPSTRAAEAAHLRWPRLNILEQLLYGRTGGKTGSALSSSLPAPSMTTKAAGVQAGIAHLPPPKAGTPSAQRAKIFHPLGRVPWTSATLPTVMRR